MKEGKITEPLLTPEQCTWMQGKLECLYYDDDISDDYMSGAWDIVCWLAYGVAENNKLKKYIKERRDIEKECIEESICLDEIFGNPKEELDEIIKIYCIK